MIDGSSPLQFAAKAASSLLKLRDTRETASGRTRVAMRTQFLEARRLRTTWSALAWPKLRPAAKLIDVVVA
jgi:hypothetical protein